MHVQPRGVVMNVEIARVAVSKSFLRLDIVRAGVT